MRAKTARALGNPAADPFSIAVITASRLSADRLGERSIMRPASEGVDGRKPRYEIRLLGSECTRELLIDVVGRSALDGARSKFVFRNQTVDERFKNLAFGGGECDGSGLGSRRQCG